MGSPLGPTLADILMTAFEEEIIKPSDIKIVLDKFNSFHPQIQFTYELFIDNNDVHFLDIKILQRALQSTASQHTQNNTCTFQVLLRGAEKQPG